MFLEISKLVGDLTSWDVRDGAMALEGGSAAFVSPALSENRQRGRSNVRCGFELSLVVEFEVSTASSCGR